MCNFQQLVKRYWITIEIALYKLLLLVLLLLLLLLLLFISIPITPSLPRSRFY